MTLYSTPCVPVELLLFGAAGLAAWWRARTAVQLRRRLIPPLPAGALPLDPEETEFDCLIVGAGERYMSVCFAPSADASQYIYIS